MSDTSGDRPDGIAQDTDAIEDSVEGDVREWVREQSPDEETQQDLLREHAHHLVRDTESDYTTDHDSPEGIEISSTAHVLDTYCFTCEEWVGLSGVDLRGTPRSRADAYYLAGPPEDVREARSKVRDGLGNLAEHALLNVEHVEDAEDAFEFVGEQHEKLAERVSEVSTDDE